MILAIIIFYSLSSKNCFKSSPAARRGVTYPPTKAESICVIVFCRLGCLRASRIICSWNWRNIQYNLFLLDRTYDYYRAQTCMDVQIMARSRCVKMWVSQTVLQEWTIKLILPYFMTYIVAAERNLCLKCGAVSYFLPLLL